MGLNLEETDLLMTSRHGANYLRGGETVVVCSLLTVRRSAHRPDASAALAVSRHCEYLTSVTRESV
jgi:hypothetical protein